MKAIYPTVSIVIASYNYATFLPLAIQSVQSQTFTDWECIIVDDCSTDSTAEVVAALVETDTRIRYYRNATNQGEAQSRNIGNGHAAGEFVAVLDADDIWHPNKLQAQMDCLLSDTCLVWSSTQGIMFSDSGEQPWIDELDFLSDIDTHLHYENFVLHSSVVVRREAVLAVGGYKQVVPIGVDWDLWLRLLDKYGEDAFKFLDDSLVRYRVHSTNMSKDWQRLLKADRCVVGRSLRRGNWWLKRPAATWHVLDERLHREIVKYSKAGHQRDACMAQLMRATLYPFQIYRWRLVAQRLISLFRHNANQGQQA